MNEPKPKPYLVQVEMFPPDGILKTNFRLFDELGIFNKIVGDFSSCEAVYDQAVAGLQKARVGSPDASSFGVDAQNASRKMSDLKDLLRSKILSSLVTTYACSGQLAIELTDRSFRVAAGIDDFHNLLTKAYEARGLWIFMFEPCDLLATDGLKSVGKIM